MALCVQLQNGAIVTDSTPPESCTGYVLLTGPEYASMGNSSIWTLPDAQAGAQLWALGLMAVVLPAFVAWCIRAIWSPLES
ncbi:MAG: hypothetical protein JSR19_01395 [Proteobacteria bacterium]|nr:hypothetical protein [Pseudomonadota bacterium]HQR02504.1 hypothetical protein [Rhodocyclaceae bacterium]